MPIHKFASVTQVAGSLHLHPHSVIQSRTAQQVKDDRLELKGQVHVQENQIHLQHHNINNLLNTCDLNAL